MNLTIVVPCFNEAGRWNQRYWDQLLRIDGISWVFVSDGSTDETARILERLHGPNASSTLLPTNLGKGEAIRHGLRLAVSQDADWVGFLDADGAFPPQEVERLVALAGECRPGLDSIWSSRVAMRGRRIHRSGFRHYAGRLTATFIGARFTDLPYDTQCGFKLFRSTTELASAIDCPFRTRWLFDIELLHRLDALHNGTNWLWEEPLMEWHEVAGSRVSLREVFRIQRELLTILNRRSR